MVEMYFEISIPWVYVGGAESRKITLEFFVRFVAVYFLITLSNYYSQ
jgi:hypothetical protein